MSALILRARAQRGLTLVELLLGLAITAIVMAPLALMFQNAVNGAAAVTTALALNSDARFAVDRIARRAAAASMVSDSSGLVVQPGVAPAPALTYTIVGRDLVETENATKSGGTTTILGTLLTTVVTLLAPTPPVTSVIATNATSLKLSAPATGSQPLLKIELTLAAGGTTVNASRTIRVGSPP